MADIRCVACFADVILNSVSNVCGAGARFSDVPVTFRVRNQIFKSKWKEYERRSWLENYSISFIN